MDDKKEPSTYELLLEEINSLKKENESIRKEIDEVKGLNRALLARKNPGSTDNTQDVKAKFTKFLEGE